jgi:hypothetical protein
MERKSMSQDSSLDDPMLDCEAARLEGAPPLTFQPLPGAAGPTYETWMQYLVYIRGAVLALGFNDGDLTERMRRGYDTDVEALEAVHAWAETERQLAAAIDILRTAQARCTLAGSRVGMRTGRRGGAEKAKALLLNM